MAQPEHGLFAHFAIVVVLRDLDQFRHAFVFRINAGYTEEAVIMEATRVTAEEIKERMARGEQFTFVDTRNPQAWGEADTKLPGAVRVPADEVDKHLSEIPRDRAVITYCT